MGNKLGYTMEYIKDNKLDNNKSTKIDNNNETTPSQSRHTNKPKNNHDPRSYPVTVKMHQGFITFSLTDFHHFSVIDAPPKGQPSKKHLLEIGVGVWKGWLKAQERLQTFDKVSKKAPSPSLASKVIESRKYKKLSVADVAKILNCSENTVRRKADRGEIPCEITDGGTRRFLEKDIL